MRLLHLVGYRGNSAEFPENTLPALRSAIALGVRFIELDVHLSADGVPMVCNEQQLARVTGADTDDTDLSGAQMQALDVSQTNIFGDKFLGTLIPTLTTALRLLEGRPEITVFVVLGRASIARFGHDQVISQVVRAMQPFRSRCVLVSKDLATIHTARTRADYPVGWIVSNYDGHTQIKVEAFKPEYVFCDLELLPAGKHLWKGPWRWAISHVADLDTALQLATRGADFVVTRNVRTLGEAMRAHAATRAAHIASMTTANAVSQRQGVSRAEVIAHVTQATEQAVDKPEVGARGSAPVRTDSALRTPAEAHAASEARASAETQGTRGARASAEAHAARETRGSAEVRGSAETYTFEFDMEVAVPA